MATDVLQNEAKTRTKAESSAFNGGRKERKHHIVGGSHCKILLQSGAERSRDTPMVLELLECHSVCMWLCVCIFHGLLLSFRWAGWSGWSFTALQNTKNALTDMRPECVCACVGVCWGALQMVGEQRTKRERER